MNFGPERDGDQKIFVSNNSKIKKYVDWQPSTNVDNGLKQIISWSEENLSLIKKTLK